LIFSKDIIKVPDTLGALAADPAKLGVFPVANAIGKQDDR
jgi:hypothetical protein